MNEIKIKFVIDNKELSKPYLLHDMLNSCIGYDYVIENMEQCDCLLNESNNHCEGDCITEKYINSEITRIVKYTGLEDKNGVEIYEGQKFKFRYKKDMAKSIELIGSFDWNENELCYEIDIHGHPQYVCLSYTSSYAMYDFELIKEK